MPKKKRFDPEGSGYDYDTATKAGLKPNKKGHWPSREPQSGLLLKGRKHETWSLLEQDERKAGYRIYKMGKRYYSVKSR